MLSLRKSSLNWALRHALNYGDTDVFPVPFEFQAIRHDWKTVESLLLKEDIHNWKPRPLRSLLSPKARYGFRIITQLDPLDFLVFASLVHEIGSDLESHRLPISENIVFSHRFAPHSNGRMYSQEIGYAEFQSATARRMRRRSVTHIAVTDIADFYPRLYAHRLENALSTYTRKKGRVTAIRKLLSGWNETESHGIPVGSAPARLLAEVTINDVDQALRANGVDYVRYSDDFRIFAKSKAQAFRHLALLAQLLYDNHGLTLQPQKTGIHTSSEFERIFLYPPEDREIDELRSQFENILSVLDLDDPYSDIEYEELNEQQRELVDSMNLVELFTSEVNISEPDITVVKFILRRMGQLGDASLVDAVVEHMDAIHPAFTDILSYFKSLRHLLPAERHRIGARVLALTTNSMVSDLDFYRMWTYSLFTESSEWDNESRFQTLLNSANDQFSRRELILAMGRAKQSHWFQSKWRHLFDEPHWTRRALLAGASCMPADARSHWYRSVTPRLDPLERAVAKWAKENPFA